MKNIIAKNDLESLKEAINFHNLQKEAKLFFTKDSKTIKIAQDILGNNYHQFQFNNINDDKINILFGDIANSKYQKEYNNNSHKKVMIAAGGPASQDQVVIAVTNKKVKKKFDDIIYITRNYLESNAHHSTKQIHSRNSSSLYSDDNFAGHKLLKNAILKSIFPKKYNIFDINYSKIDLKIALDATLIKIYYQNELNWIKQKIKKIFGQKTLYDLDQEYAEKSVKIQKQLEKNNNINLRNDKLPAMEIIFKEQKNISKPLKKYKKLAQDKIDKIFGNNNVIKDVIFFNQDGCLRYDIYDINAKIAKDNGAKCLDEVEISQILIDKKNNRLAGIVTKDEKYIYASKLHLSLGYKAKYSFDKNLNLRPKISNNIVASGLSMVIIVKNSKKLRNILSLSSAILLNDIYISFIKSNDHYILLKIASGANIASDKYKSSYFFNILYHLRLIFTDDLIAILSCYACQRSINGQNSTKFTKINDDVIISDGKGGSGNSKRYYEAINALNYLGIE